MCFVTYYASIVGGDSGLFFLCHCHKSREGLFPFGLARFLVFI